MDLRSGCQPPAAPCPSCGRPMDATNPRRVMPDPFDLVPDAQIILWTRCWQQALGEERDGG